MQWLVYCFLLLTCYNSLSYDEFLQLSQKGDNFVLDLIVKDICGELVCQKVCLHPFCCCILIKSISRFVFNFWYAFCSSDLAFGGATTALVCRSVGSSYLFFFPFFAGWILKASLLMILFDKSYIGFHNNLQKYRIQIYVPWIDSFV
jgi:hypothetical protein